MSAGRDTSRFRRLAIPCALGAGVGMAAGYAVSRGLFALVEPYYYSILEARNASEGVLGFIDVMYLFYVLRDLCLFTGTVVGCCVGYRIGRKRLDKPRAVSVMDDARVWPPAPQRMAAYGKGPEQTRGGD